MQQLHRITLNATMMSGAKIVVANRWFPSNKTCSVYGAVVKELPLAVRNRSYWECGARHDRDLNAAIKLKKLGREFHGISLWKESSGLECKNLKLKPASVKQELSAKDTYG